VRKNNNNRGKAHAALNFFTLVAIIVGLSVYFTVQSHWQAGTIVIIVLLMFPAAFYLWLWRKYFR